MKTLYMKIGEKYHNQLLAEWALEDHEYILSLREVMVDLWMELQLAKRGGPPLQDHEKLAKRVEELIPCLPE